MLYTGKQLQFPIYEESNFTASFEEHLKFKKVTFTDALWINCSNLK